MSKAAHVSFHVHMIVPQTLRNESRTICDEVTGKPREFTLREQAEYSAIEYIKAVATGPSADDLLLRLVHRVEQLPA